MAPTSPPASPSPSRPGPGRGHGQGRGVDDTHSRRHSYFSTTPGPHGTSASPSSPSGPSSPYQSPPPQQSALRPPPPQSLAHTLWNLYVPIFITHTSQPTAPFITSVPRFGYLALLLPRLEAYYGTPCSSFHHEQVQLRNLAVGLLVDLYQPTLPWHLVVSDGPEWDIADTFMNSAKEADFVRNGNAKQIMSLSKDNTTALWNAVQDNDYAAFTKINNHLLNAPTALKNVPIRIYIPSSPAGSSNDDIAAAGSFKVMQTLIQPRLPNRSPQTLGNALKTILPTLFPSSRDPVLANVVLHGAPVPFNAPLDELMRDAAYPDGWLCLVVVLL